MTIEEKTYKVSLCGTWEELDSILEDIGDVEGSSAIYSPEMTRRGIALVRAGNPINRVTRGCGLRAKVAELLHYGD